MPLQMAKQLISSGADVDAIDEEGNTALMLSVVCEHLVSHSSHFIGVCCAVLWCVMCCAVLCCVLCSVLYCDDMCSVMCCAMLRCVLCGAVMLCAILHRAVLYCTVLCCAVYASKCCLQVHEYELHFKASKVVSCTPPCILLSQILFLLSATVPSY
jgi:hypothetical protein